MFSFFKTMFCGKSASRTINDELGHCFTHLVINCKNHIFLDKFSIGVIYLQMLRTHHIIR